MGGRWFSRDEGGQDGRGWDITLSHNSFTPLILLADPRPLSCFLFSLPFPFTGSAFYLSVFSPLAFLILFPSPPPLLFMSLSSILPVRPRACSHFRWELERVVTRCTFVCVCACVGVSQLCKLGVASHITLLRTKPALTETDQQWYTVGFLNEYEKHVTQHCTCHWSITSSVLFVVIQMTCWLVPRMTLSLQPRQPQIT